MKSISPCHRAAEIKFECRQVGMWSRVDQGRFNPKALPRTHISEGVSHMNFDCQQHAIIRLNECGGLLMARSPIYRIYQIIDCIFYDQICRECRPTDQLCVLVKQITMHRVLLPMVGSCCQFSINHFWPQHSPEVRRKKNWLRRLIANTAERE